jgi:hypothetical protein
MTTAGHSSIHHTTLFVEHFVGQNNVSRNCTRGSPRMALGETSQIIEPRCRRVFRASFASKFPELPFNLTAVGKGQRAHIGEYSTTITEP